MVDEEVELLRSAGHEVTEWSPQPDGSGALGLLAAGTSAVWSRRAVAEIARLASGRFFDIIHVHNVFPVLSPAVIRAAARRAPVVMTLHNYRLMCLPAVFLRDGRTCEDCIGRVPWRGVVHRCYKGSVLGSGALAASLAIHRAIGTFDRVSVFLAGSEFTKDKHVEGGLPPDRIVVKPNFAHARRLRRGPGEYYLFLGRLWPEKGAAMLLEAWSKDPPGRLVVVGDGPERARLQARAPSGVEFMGQIPHEQVDAVLERARALLVPSFTYETSSRATLEAYAAGVPVLASDIGALAEMVVDGVSGLRVPVGDPAAWRRAARRLLNDDSSVAMGRGAHQLWRERYSPEQAIANLERAYDRARREHR